MTSHNVIIVLTELSLSCAHVFSVDSRKVCNSFVPSCQQQHAHANTSTQGHTRLPYPLSACPPSLPIFPPLSLFPLCFHQPFAISCSTNFCCFHLAFFEAIYKLLTAGHAPSTLIPSLPLFPSISTLPAAVRCQFLCSLHIFAVSRVLIAGPLTQPQPERQGLSANTNLR